jgi:hypothetical protein
MLILCDNKMPEEAMLKLSGYGEVVKFATEGITYDAISGHPDIFFCKTPGGLVVAPNLPATYFNILDQNSIQYSKGKLPVGKTYPESARYNTLVTKKYIIQNPQIADPLVAELNPNHEIIAVKQGYVQCNLLALPNDSFITSDLGIEKSLKKHDSEVLFVNPLCIKLDGFEHGFIGGACGLHEQNLFVCGSLKNFKEQGRIESFTERAGVSIIELYDGPPVDVGTILFLDKALI